MTTIAYRDGVLAADTLVSTNSGWRDGSMSKVVRRGRLLAAACGNTGCMQVFLDWVRAGCRAEPPRMDENTEGAIFMPDGLIIVFEQPGATPIRTPFYAMGSGARFAIGAMEAGAGAVEAVAIACRRDTASGGRVQKLQVMDR